MAGRSAALYVRDEPRDDRAVPEREWERELDHALRKFLWGFTGTASRTGSRTSATARPVNGGEATATGCGSPTSKLRDVRGLAEMGQGELHVRWSRLAFSRFDRDDEEPATPM